MYFIFDTETTGLPARGGPLRGYFHPKLVNKYDNARLVSIAWIVLNSDLNELKRGSALILPNGFKVPEESTRIHGISHQHAVEHGKDIQSVFDELVDDLAKCKCIVAHNVWFDVNVFKSECYRSNNIECLALFDRCVKYCTMAKGKELLGLPKYPTLSLLYQELFGQSLCNAHNASYDTLHCCACFRALKHIPHRGPIVSSPASSLAQPKRTRKQEVSYTNEQLAIINSEPSNSMLVLACPGSGKTHSIIGRIVHLITKHGVSEESIILTTFTRDAARQMKNRLEDVLGRDTRIVVGTIDALSLKFLRDTNHDTEHLDIAEYTPCCAALFRTQLGRSFASRFKYLFVDEFQDINRNQFELIKALFDNNTIITAVGDDAQNIYSFRGSDVGYTLRFSTLFPKSKSFRLTANFRSTQCIVDVANTVINKEMVSSTRKRDRASSGGAPVAERATLNFFKTFDEECANLHYRICDYTRSKRVKLNEIAILCPQNHFLYRIEEYFAKVGIPTFFMDGSSGENHPLQNEKVCLSTIHKAKGLEWSVVFLVIATDNIYCVNDKQESEGRNLFYVGITRPKDKLHISYSPVNGCNKPTRFINKNTMQVLDASDLPIIQFSSSNQRNQRKEESTSTETKKTNHWSAAIGGLLEVFPPPEFVSTLNITTDYELFLRTVVMRMYGVKNNATPYPFLSARVALASITVDYEQFMVFKKYIDSNRHKLDIIAKFLGNIPQNKAAILKHIASPTHPVDSSEVGLLLGLLKRMHQASTTYSIPLPQVKVFGKHAPLIPKHFRDLISESYEICKDATLKTTDILHHLWHVTACSSILQGNRKRMLHIPIDHKDRLQQLKSAMKNLSNYVEELQVSQWFDYDHILQMEHDYYFKDRDVEPQASC
jgi:DNA polymerase III epsilon subunit-like protein